MDSKEEIKAIEAEVESLNYIIQCDREKFTALQDAMNANIYRRISLQVKLAELSQVSA